MKVLARLMIVTILLICFLSCHETTNFDNHHDSLFHVEVDNSEVAINGGTLQYGLVDSSGFKGLFERVFYTSVSDYKVIQFINPGLLSSHPSSYMIDEDGAAIVKYDLEKKTVTFELKNLLYWHDQTLLTMNDLLFAYEVIAHPDYDGPRYNHNIQNIVGIEEYHEGKTDTICGIKVSNDGKKITFQMKTMYPSLLYSDSLWHSPMPRHYWMGIDVKDMSSHEKTRLKPLGYGAFKISQVIPGEVVEMVANEHYFLGRPVLNKVIIKCVNPDFALSAMKEGRFDIIDNIDPMQYKDYPAPKNFQYLAKWARAYTYLGFKLGTWDNEHTCVLTNSEAKMIDPELRKAIGFALNVEEVCQTIYEGFRKRANSIVDAGHAFLIDENSPSFYYNPDLAKEILDKAGYIDLDQDGFRENKNGQQFTISFAAKEEGANRISETIVQNYIENLKAVGLNVTLYGGRLQEFNHFYDNLKMDVAGIDMYMAAWFTGFDPNPTRYFGKKVQFNYPRYTSLEFEKILNEISSEKAFDENILKNLYSDWQYLFFNESPTIPLEHRMDVYAVNNRVKNYHILGEEITPTWHKVALTNDIPYTKK